MTRNYKIKKGSHYSRPWWPKLHLGIDEMTITFRLSELFYDHSLLPAEDVADINKLFGFSRGHHHKNSVRVGWYCIDDEMYLMSYRYNDGRRAHTTLCSINMNHESTPGVDEVTITIRRVGDCIYNMRSRELGLIHNFFLMGPEYGYLLKPYFGGNNPAVRDFNIGLTVKYR